MRTAGVLTLAFVWVACGDEPAGPGDSAVARLALSVDSVLDAGQTAVLSAVARTQDGHVVAGAPVTFVSLDPAVAAVQGTAVVGVHPGTARVVASVGAVTDTALVRVRPGVPAPGEMAGSIRSADGTIRAFRWTGLATANERLYDLAGSVSGLAAYNMAHLFRDSMLSVVTRGLLAAGTYDIEPFPLGGGVFTSTIASISVGEGPDRQMYFGLGGTLIVRAAQYPALPGHTRGAMTATLDFRATRYLTGPGSAPLPTADTVHVTAELVLPLAYLASGSAQLTLAGAGPVTGTAVRTLASASADGAGGLFVGWEADFDGAPGGFPWEAAQQFRLFQPGTGTFAVASLTPALYDGPEADWPAVFSTIGYRDEGREGLSTGGTLTISEYRAPTVMDYGLIRGTLTTSLELWNSPAERSGEHVHAVAAFAVPINPLGGVPN